MARAKEGDVDAYGLLVDRHRPAACRIAYAIAGDDAEDAAQEAFVKAYLSIDRFRSGSPFRPWLLAIVANEARNRRRSAGRRARIELRVRPPGEPPSPEDAVVADDQRRALAHAISLLGDRDRLVIAYRYFADLSEAEMAVAMSCAPGTVKSRLARAVARLRAVMMEEGAGRG